MIRNGRSAMKGESMDNLKNVYLTSTGRLARLPYFLYALGLLAILIVLSLVLVAILGTGGVLLAYLICLYSFYCLMAKRLQDFDKPGKWAWGVIAIGLVGGVLSVPEATMTIGQLVSFLQFILALIILFMPGTAGGNQYGPAPGSAVGT
jgi:uncharacterized membrane protein YhaH (DUF805 family)